MAHVLFVCLRNAGRSQMSQALFERAAAGTGHEAASAGTTPATRVHPQVVEALRELGIGLTPKGTVFEFAVNRLNNSELAGATFSPNGKNLFVNIFGESTITPNGNEGMTIAITGPWRQGPL